MHRTTSRFVKRFNRSSSSRGFLDQLPKADSDGSPSHLAQDNLNSFRRRRVVHLQLDLLRGAMLVAIIVVTIILYLALWELERSSFASKPEGNRKPNPPNRTTGSRVVINSERILEKHTVSPAVVNDVPISRTDGQASLPDGRSAVSSGPTGRSTQNAATWPPPITRVPDEHVENLQEKISSFPTKNDSEPPASLSGSFDITYCNGTCRFLLPVRVGEQESKARLHFTQLLKLAQKLNRTLVLPNVGNSRMSACSKWPFEAYYDASAFASGFPSLPTTMNFSTFTKWIEERPALPSTFVISMDSPAKDHWRALESLHTHSDLPFIIEESGVDSKVLSCLESKHPRLRSSTPATALSILFSSSAPKMYPNVSAHLVEFLSGPLDTHADSDFDLMTGTGYEYPHLFDDSFNTTGISLSDMNVLAVDYDLRYPVFTRSESDPHFNLHYAPALYDLADRISDNLGPFVGVHWRMENVPVENLAWCAASLVSTLHRFLQHDVMGKNVRHVWLATDYPLHLASNTNDARFITGLGQNENAKGITEERSLLQHRPARKSSTFKSISPEHEDAMEMFTEAFQTGGDLDAWKLTDLAEQLRRYPYVEGKFDIDEALLNDSGVFGILDKLVVVQAKVFVSGSPECSKVSSFSKQVIEARQESFEADRGRKDIRNVVEYFGK